MRSPESPELRRLGLLAGSSAVIVACLVLSATGAGADAVPVSSESDAALCLTPSQGGDYTVVAGTLTSRRAVDVTAVGLGGAEGVELGTAYLVPVLDREPTSESRWPPSKQSIAALGPAWEQRQTAVGPDRLAGDGPWSLVVRVRTAAGPPQPGVGFDRVVVAYRDGDDRRDEQLARSFEVRGSC